MQHANVRLTLPEAHASSLNKVILEAGNTVIFLHASLVHELLSTVSMTNRL